MEYFTKYSTTLRFLVTAVSLVIISFFSVWAAGTKLSSPATTKVGPPPEGHTVENIVFDGVHGWFFPAARNHTCMLLLHGIRSNRKEMVDIALFLKDKGYASLVIDLQAHGESSGQAITFGYRESSSAHSAFNFLKTEKTCKKVVAIGRSLGAASSLLGPKPIDADGFILEAVYSNIKTAVQNRLEIHFGAIGKIIAPLFYYQIPLRLGIKLEELQPLAAIKNIQAPVLILSGTQDKRTKVSEAQAIFEEAPHPKQFVAIADAAHVNLYKFNPEQYEKVVLDFLANTLKL